MSFSVGKVRSHSASRWGACGILLGALTIALGALPASGASTSHSPITLRLFLPSHTVVAGSAIHARLTIVNSSPHAVSMGGVCPGEEILVGLSNGRITFVPIYPTNACFGFKVPPGRTVVAVRISASYNECGSNTTPRCTAKGMPGLPPGTYHTSVYVLGFPKGTIRPPSTTVVVRASKST